MKTTSLAVLAATITTQAFAQECDIICMGIYSIDEVACECVPIEWMECHPQYHNGEQNPDCNQWEVDEEEDRLPWKNPYQDEEWYIENENQFEDADGN